MEKLRTMFPVLWSPRFWGIVAMAAAIQARDLGWISTNLANFIATICGVSAGVGTLDRASEYMGTKPKK